MENVKVLARELIYSGKVIKLVREELQYKNSVKVRETVEHPGAIVVIPMLENGNLLLINQYRHSINDWILEFPAGTLENSESPVVCAHREIMEEVSMKTSELIELGKLVPTPGFCNEIQYCYIAKKLTPCNCSCEEDEIIEVREMSVLQVKDAIKSNILVDAKSIAIFTKALFLGLI